MSRRIEEVSKEAPVPLTSVKEIILENFMSYEYARIPLREGLNLIVGPNGAGKSSVLLAISVAFGQAYTERSRKLSDLIRDDNSEKPFESAFALALQDTLAIVLGKLSEREMRIIKLRFGLDGEGPFTLEETGKALGITRERVRQIQERALVKIRQLRVSRELETFMEG